MSRRLLLCIALCAGLAGCEAQNVRNREKGALAGGALGAGLGAIVGNQVGSTGAGIAIGSAIGALSGGLIGNEMDNSENAAAEQDRRIADQDRELAENRRMLDELRSRGLDVHETNRGLVVNLPDVLFEFGSAALTGSARRSAADIAAIIRREGGHRNVAVEGHTDSIGSYSYNQRLSEDRAHSVAGALVSNGVARRQLEVKGFGETRPIASNNSDDGRRRNRRVEVIIENR
ncbi:MAG: OmpA family protein [Oligoflexia bacterium]|nr:OmpA family protein [Oligoflexia bacterium]